MPWSRIRAALLGAAAAAASVLLGTALLRRLRAGRPAPAAPIRPGLLDLNAASPEELQALPGIGPARARRIVASRESHGPFGSPHDLLARGLLPASVFEQIKEAVTAGP